MSQKIEDINIKSLVLWTENPRDKINPNTTDQDIADRAINSDKKSKWHLEKIFNKMGSRFDKSEIPTIVYVNNKPVVFDGNRRVLIGKIINNHITVDNCPDFSNFDFPEIIPCNVCDKQTALEHVDRKHADSGSWGTLERDIFKHKEMNKEKSPFLILEESTRYISSNPELNKRFVKEEILTSTNLNELGLFIEDDQLLSNYRDEKDVQAILNKIVDLISNGTISTRKARGNILTLLKEDTSIAQVLNKKTNEKKPLKIQTITRTTPTTTGKQHKFFGKKISLKAGSVNNIYCDLGALYKTYKSKAGTKYSTDFPMIIRMGLRLLCELAAQDENIKFEEYIKNKFEKAKNKLSKDEKTTLSSQFVTQEKLLELLNIGAHGYTATNNIEQTIALSLIIEQMLISNNA